MGYDIIDNKPSYTPIIPGQGMAQHDTVHQPSPMDSSTEKGYPSKAFMSVSLTPFGIATFLSESLHFNRTPHQQ